MARFQEKQRMQRRQAVSGYPCELVVFFLLVALGAIKPFGAARGTNRDLRIENVFAHLRQRESKAQVGDGGERWGLVCRFFTPWPFEFKNCV